MKKALGTRTLPKITIVVAGKRHHTRFYVTREADTEDKRNFNTPGGTVVDRGVTMERGHDFFLQAHHALQGHAKPTHYVVIKDEMGLGADDIQNATHALCYLFGRATKAVSLCPPAFYADILCERGRRYLAKWLSQGNASASGGSDAIIDFDRLPWKGGVHPRLENTMVCTVCSDAVPKTDSIFS